MDLKTQEYVSRIMCEQAEKLGVALSALRKIAKSGASTPEVKMAAEALKEISQYGESSKGL